MALADTPLNMTRLIRIILIYRSTPGEAAQRLSEAQETTWARAANVVAAL